MDKLFWDYLSSIGRLLCLMLSGVLGCVDCVYFSVYWFFFWVIDCCFFVSIYWWEFGVFFLLRLGFGICVFEDLDKIGELFIWRNCFIFGNYICFIVGIGWWIFVCLYDFLSGLDVFRFFWMMSDVCYIVWKVEFVMC